MWRIWLQGVIKLLSPAGCNWCLSQLIWLKHVQICSFCTAQWTCSKLILFIPLLLISERIPSKQRRHAQKDFHGYRSFFRSLDLCCSWYSWQELQNPYQVPSEWMEAEFQNPSSHWWSAAEPTDRHELHQIHGSKPRDVLSRQSSEIGNLCKHSSHNLFCHRWQNSTVKKNILYLRNKYKGLLWPVSYTHLTLPTTPYV